jgi:nucleoside 2-deoxyribosyltransferase
MAYAKCVLDVEIFESLVAHYRCFHAQKLSGWTRAQTFVAGRAELNTTNVPLILDRPEPSVKERANRLLVECARFKDGLVKEFDVTEPRFLAATYSENHKDVRFLLGILIQEGLVDKVTKGGFGQVTALGLMRLDETANNSSKSQGFMAMWFSEELSEVWSNGFEPAIFDSGYDPLRIDKFEHVNKIDDEIIAQINASRFLVADFTGHRGGVYFEAGYALGIGIPVFWTCKDDELDKLHFDIRQYNCINWTTEAELRSRLDSRIRAVLGPGPKYIQ